MVCRTCALFLLVKLFRLLHVQRVEREVLQRVPASLEAWMKWIKWMKWMKSDMSLYDSPHALHLEDIIRSIVCSYYSSIGHIGSYRISSDQTTDFLSIDVPIIFESFIEILRSQKKNNVLPWWSPTQATSDSDRDVRAEEIRRDFEPHRAMKMTRDDKHTELPRCYDLRVITAHAWLYI